MDELEPTGWLTKDIVELAAEIKCKIELVEVVLKKLQEIEPAGFFARNLKGMLNSTGKRC